MPSMQAPDRPRRPIRRMQRTRESCRARPRTTSQVPSGELSSTKMTSQALPASAVSSRRYSVVTLSRSLKVGTTTESAGVATACGGLSGPGLMASFMRQRISDSPRGSQGAVGLQLRRNSSRGSRKRTETGPKMPTTTNRGRAYIRRSLTIQWSSQRRSYEASTSPLEARWGWRRRSARGRHVHGAALLRHLPHHRSPRGGRRGGRWRRRLNLRHRFRRRFSDRPVHERDRQHRGGNDRTQYACDFLRIHCDIPAVSPVPYRRKPGIWRVGFSRT